MKYPIVIELGNDTEAHAVYIPDLEVSTAGDTIEDCYTSAIEASKEELGNFLRSGRKIPMPSSADAIISRDEYKGMSIGMIDIDITPYLGKVEKITISVPSSVIAMIDKHVIDYGIKSRSAFITDACINAIRQ